MHVLKRSPIGNKFLLRWNCRHSFTDGSYNYILIRARKRREPHGLDLQVGREVGVPVVVGTTGWYDQLPEVTRVAKETGTSLLWSPNFSLGVNVMIELARYAGTLMRTLEDFDAHIVETHHAMKKDAPSGTAIAIAKAASDALERPIPSTSVRTGSVPGTHELIFDAAFEQLSLTHLARDRRVFAEGALKAADWLIGKQGVFTMRDVLELPGRKSA